MAEDLSIDRVGPLDASKTSKVEQQLGQKLTMNQIASQEISSGWTDEAFSPTLMARRFETLENKARRIVKDEEAEKTERKEEIREVEKLSEVSEGYSRKNPELQARSLLLLRARIKQGDTKEEILHKILEMYPDYSLADEALDFLLETTGGELAIQVRLAKEELNLLYGREVRAGRNISEQAREFSKQGLGSPTALRDLYREITGNPRDASSLFEELTTKFHYDRMRTVIDFVLHSLGNDLKARGPSIDRGELHRLFSEARSMQAILGIFRFFKSRMTLIEQAFARQGIRMPLRITYEFLAKLFMKLLQERYPSSDKVMQMASQLGLLEEYLGLITIYTQMRDAVRHIAPKLFKSEQHRQDVLTTLIDTIEDLDEKIEKEEEKEEEEEKEKEKNQKEKEQG